MLNMFDRKPIRSQARQIAANVLKVREEEPKLVHYLYRKSQQVDLRINDNLIQHRSWFEEGDRLVP